MIRLGRITIPAGVSKNNTDTAVPFEIPQRTRGLYLLASADGLRYKSATDSVSPSTLTAAATDFPLYGSSAFGETTINMNGGPLVVAAYNTTGGQLTLDVYAVQG